VAKKGGEQMFKKFFIAEDGQGMVEYGLLAALIAVAVIGTIVLMRGQLINVFNRIKDGLSST
jgi:pilus assembly protein Flp/PilA